MDMGYQKVEKYLEFPMRRQEWLAEKFKEINKNQEHYVLVSINLKKFKYFNLKYGWEQGNEILYNIYQSLQKELSEGEYIAHIFADSYALLLRTSKQSMPEPETLEFIRTTIMKYIDAIFEVDDDRVYKDIYASIGIYPASIKTCDYHEAFEMADLFRREDLGLERRTFSVNYYSEEVFDLIMQKYELQKSTANALAKGEYRVYVQPKVDIKTSKIVGGEALLRRFGSDGKPIPLSEFLPILNSEGYIRKVDWYVFETVCAKIEERLKKGKPVVPVSFNISKDFFYDVYLCDNYIETYKKYNVPQEYIEFELMETISLDDIGRMIEVVKEFKKHGFRCSLDDFGNGYSSFGVLLNVEFDYIKLDRVFFMNPLNENSKAIIKGVIDMLKFLGLKIVAEGVETKEYVDYLLELGCDVIQGYYFYKPMPLDEFMELLG